MHDTANDLIKRLTTAGSALRNLLEPHFAPDTAYPGTHRETCPSSGHCGAVSVVAYNHWEFSLLAEGLRLNYASSVVDGMEHWFLRVSSSDAAFDVDLTGDQFGRSAVQVALAGSLYPNTVVRPERDLESETLERASALAMRARVPMPLRLPVG